MATLDRQPIAARLFHEQDWGGFLEAECQPIRRSYLDDRFELFGKEAIVEYVDVLTGGPAWDTSATATGSTWSGSAPTVASPGGCSRSRVGRSSISIGLDPVRTLRGRNARRTGRDDGPPVGIRPYFLAASFPRTALISSPGKVIVHSLTWPACASNASSIPRRDCVFVEAWSTLASRNA